ncbi:MAG: hypothetical protein J7M34_05065 [Anaerolineae bacterium]|nr:hypothetical protein [Anaerolineae bacterium]
MRSEQHDVHLVFARYVRGFEGWHYMEKAFTSPRTKAYFRQRVERMLGEIQRSLRSGV